MKILITGATGFIGKHLVNKLFYEGNDVFITLLPCEESPFSEIKVNYFILEGDYMQNLIKFLSDNSIDGVIHLASFVQSGEHKTEDLVNLIDTNIKFSTFVLESAVNAKVKWFVNTGTYWQHYNNEEYNPVNIYAATKQAFMDIAKYYWDCNKIQFNTLMLYDTYGPNDTRPKIFNLWDCIAKLGERLDMSPGEQIVDISHVYDIVDNFIKLANKLYMSDSVIKNGDVFAVLASQRYTLRELAKKYELDNNVQLNINWGGKPYRDREVMIPYYGKKIPE